MNLSSTDFAHGGRIPEALAFGRPGDNGEPCVLSSNRNPALSWEDVPAATRSFALICVDPDVPSRGDDVNQPGRSVPARLPRVDFCHWLLANIPADCRQIAAGSCSDGVTARGKRQPAGPAGSVQGINDYTGWFAADAEMAGDYFGYDGPCPPFNDSIPHRYFFRLFALDVAQLELPIGFGMAALLRAMQGHVLAETSLFGCYSLNPLVKC